MLSVAELIAKGKVPGDTKPAHNQAGYPDGWPIFTDLTAQVRYDWDYLPSDRVRSLKGDPAYKTALETMLTGAKPAATDGGASEIPASAAAAAMPGTSPEESIINATEPPIPTNAVEEPPVVPQSAVAEPTSAAGPAEDEPGTRFDIEYGYVLKTTDGWEVHIQVEDSGENIFKARTQKELIAALAKANAHATAKLRQLNEEREAAILNAEPDPVVTRVRLAPRALNADEQFEFAEAIASGNPTRINKAMAKRDAIILGGPVEEVISQVNETRDYQEIETYKAVAKAFMRQNPDVRFNKALGDKIDAILAENQWGYTVRNLNKALAQLKANGEVAEEVSTPSVEPVIPVPTGETAVTPAPSAKPATPAAPAKPAPAAATNQPAAAAPPKTEARLRPGSASTGISPRQASVRAGVAPEVKAVGLTAEEYNRMSVSDTRRKYKTDPGFRAAVDKLIAEGKI